MNDRTTEIIAKLKASESMMQDCHDDAWKDLAFEAGDQFDRDRKGEGRTNEVFNQIPGIVNPIVNAVKQAPPSIKINPLGPGAQMHWAKHVAARIRMTEQQCHANKARLYAFKKAVSCGIGWWRSVPRTIDGMTRTVTETILDPTSVFPDAMSREPDFSDAKHIFQKNKASRRALLRLSKGDKETGRKDSEYFEANEFTADDEDSLVDTVEFWTIESGILERVILCNDLIVAEEKYEAAQGGHSLGKLPYSFVHGDFYQDKKDGSRHYAGVTRYARADQVLINYTRNEIISEIEGSPKADFVAQADSVEGYETEWKTANRIRRIILRMKDVTKLIPIPRNANRVPEYAGIADSARQSMGQIVGVAPTQQNGIEQVSGKSARLQISQSGVQNYQYSDAYNMAIERDGEIYLDQLLAYERDGVVRPILGDDGRTVSHVLFGSGEAGEGVEVVDIRPGQFGVAVSTGASYGTQMEQMQDYSLELMKIPALGPVVPIILATMLKQLPIPGSEDMAQGVMMSLPPALQQMMAAKGDKSAALAQATQQAQQAGAMLQQCQAQVQQLAQALQQSQSALSTRGAIQERDNETKIEIERIKGENALILEQIRQAGTQELEAQRAGHQIITDFAKVSPVPPAAPFAPMRLAQDSIPGIS